MTRAFTQNGRRGGKTAMRTALGQVFKPIEQSHGNVVALRPPAASKSPAKQPKPKFAADPMRRARIAKIKIAQKALDFDDGDYRALLNRVTGRASCTDMTLQQLDKVLDEFKRLGWEPVKLANPAKPRPADHPGARKARALWISLSLLGVIRQPSEAALEAFARRQLGCDRLQWADQSQVYKLIEALKRIATRHGWDQKVEGLADPIWTLKLRLCEAIVKRCVAAGALPVDATLATVAADRIGSGGDLSAAPTGGPVMALLERDLETLAAFLGQALAAHVAADYYED